MKLLFRWYGEKDPVTLKKIRQIPCVTGVVTAVYGVPAGEIWPEKSILALKRAAEAEGLTFEVVESIPVHEDIKLGAQGRDKYISAFCENVRRVARAGVRCVTYNFMPVFDWLRTDLNHMNADGSSSLSFSQSDLDALDPSALRLPGWDESYAPDELKALLDAYREMSREKLFGNLVYFLEKVIPVCDETNVALGVHPDDPPWKVLGIPRVVSTEEDIDRIFDAVPSKNNGLTLCTGSLGSSPEGDIARMAAKYASQGRVPFAHLRNVSHPDGGKTFRETAHPSPCGSLDMAKIVLSLVKNGFDGYVRPDHGRKIWDEEARPGYGLYDRALGAAYINGLFEMAKKTTGGRP
ncbi:MAG: mannonate dehydratase [Clostridia bacterium]|nr:mannonate dehydratase [Clostridia bacterium]